ncbi:MAG: response regulator [Terracidiphilus sp.]|jgi:two-component system chemotaxis response regulator CheY
MKTLVVEDEFTNRILMQNLLARYGECHIAIDGEEAVEAFRMALAAAAPYDLICMDIRMPKMDGVEAVNRIRALEIDDGVLSSNGVKIMMVTSVDDPKEVVGSFQALCDAYLVKPIRAADLSENLHRMQLIA